MKYSRVYRADIDRYASHKLNDIHFPGEEVFESLVSKLDKLGDLMEVIHSPVPNVSTIAVQIIASEREAAIDTVTDNTVHTFTVDIVNFTVTLLFDKARPFTFFFEVPFKNAEDTWEDEAVSSFISQATRYIARKARRRAEKA
ncbi:MAG: hypothetical protein ACRDCE_17945 [Cetobacterium sp.]|uniref:hypothetical protein n=1 Tax=Cetobacterium sp. TaxID=2071632 RepID=UPI003EE7D0DC